MCHTTRIILATALVAFAFASGCSTPPRLDAFDPLDPYDSGGPLSGEQAAFDVLRYELDVEVFPDRREIEGELLCIARVGSPIAHLTLDLDPVLTVRGARAGSSPDARPLAFEREGGKLRVEFGRTAQPGDNVEVCVSYGGAPRVAIRAPWTGGFTWESTASGEHWIATTCQGEGADLWWPVKDHVSDSPESMRIRATVPAGLVVASNGRLAKTEDVGNSRVRFTWEVSTPIETYNVTLQIAPYEVLERDYESVSGDSIPVRFFALPENREKATHFLDEVLDHLRFFEEALGPYPFRADKYGVAETPHLGMEHQSIIAYGARYDRKAMTRGIDWGFNALHHHELSHEWWGNLVTNADWSDMWLHEGFGSYMQPLYLERRQGPERAREYLATIRKWITNEFPVAPRRSLSSSQVYGGDIYFKGAWILHTLRFLMGDERFFVALRRMAYPSEESEASRDGSACRFATSDDFIGLVESIHSGELDWFFEVYLRRTELPRLEVDRQADSLELAWILSDPDLEFSLPIEIQVDDRLLRVEMPNGRARLAMSPDAEIMIDPQGWILRAED